MADSILGPPEDIIVIPERTEKFVVDKRFVKYRRGNFDDWFFGKSEEPVGQAILQAQQVWKRSNDSEIIAELGGNLKARITLADIKYAIKKGALRKDPYMTYIGYVEDSIRFSDDKSFSYVNEKGERCVLRVVRCNRYGSGWNVQAYSIHDQYESGAAYQFLSRNPIANP